MLVEFVTKQHIALTVTAIFACLFIRTSAFSSFTENDVYSIIQHYFMECGSNNLCYASSFNFSNKMNTTEDINRSNLCPKCTCDDACYVRRDCCPDVYFSHVLRACRSFIITSRDRKQDTYDVIDSCPHDSHTSLKEACSERNSPIDMLYNPPVTSKVTYVSYKNKFCAECNKDSSVVPWHWYVRCRESKDFNFMTSYSDLIQTAESGGCVMEYAPFRISATRCDQVVDDSILVDKCNISKNWFTENNVIQKACESGYRNKIGIFANVFCRMCNPPYVNEFLPDVTSVCVSKSTNQDIISACKHHPMTEDYGRYKHRFCHQCINDEVPIWIDVNASVTESFSEEGSFEYWIQIDSYHDQYIKNIIEDYSHRHQGITDRPFMIGTPVIKDSGSVMVEVSPGISVNLSNIVQKYFALEPKMVCNTDLLPQNVSSYAYSMSGCSCDPACVFNDICHCCVDTALLSNVNCVSDKMLSPHEIKGASYLAVDTCQNKGLDSRYFKIVSDLCQGRNRNILSIPVFHKMSGVTYKNVFCLLCNERISMSSVLPVITDKYLVWDIKIECSSRIDMKYGNMIDNMIDSAQLSDCDVTLLPKKARVCQSHDEDIMTSCNTTGFWPNHDPDIRWACENVSSAILPPYIDNKNVFCGLCNPTEKFEEDPVDKCNVTGKWLDFLPAMEEGCHQLPMITNPLIFPFKNDFCAFCNGYDVPHFLLPHEYCYKEPVTISLQKKSIQERDSKISVITVYQNLEPQTPLTKNAHHSVFDPILNHRRDLSCYPGRYFAGNQCSVLIKKSINLRYSIALTLEGFVKQDGERELRMIGGLIFQYLRQKLNVRSIDIESRYMLSNLTCDPAERATEEIPATIHFHGILYMRSVVNREEVEDTLLSLHMGTDFDHIEDSDFNLTFVHSKETYNLPTIINSGMTRGRCFVSEHSFVSKEQVQHTMYVSKMLTCTHVPFLSNEVIFSESKIQVHIKSYNRTFHNDDFFITEKGNIRICTEDFELMTNITQVTIEPLQLGNKASSLTLCTFNILLLLFLFKFAI